MHKLKAPPEWRKVFKFRAGVAARLLLIFASAIPAFSSGLTYTCDPNLSSAACTGLNSIESLYNSSFTNANANIYVEMSSLGGAIGQSTYEYNPVTYSSYVAALQSSTSGNTVQQDAIASLPSSEPSMYGSGDVVLTSALADALGITNFTDGSTVWGVTTAGAACALGKSTGCYDGLIQIASSGYTYYYRTGTPTGTWYDFFSVVEHETDEIFGTASCVDVGGTSGNPTFSDACSASLSSNPNGTDISPADLFRYDSTTSHNKTTIARVFESTTVGAYFSYDGGQTNDGQGATYNTDTPGEDYGDFTNSCQFIQDANACSNSSIDITNDGTSGGTGPEVTVLNAVGYRTENPPGVPEPGTLSLLALALLVAPGFRGALSRSRPASARRRPQ